MNGRLAAMLLICSLAAAAEPPVPAAAVATSALDSAVTPGIALSFPRDFGAHPSFKTEWWYVTGWLETADGQALGFQITFFRSRTPPALLDGNPSAFAPKQLLAAHAALSDPRLPALLHDQRAAREGFGLAAAGVGDTAVRIDRWALRREADGRYSAAMNGEEFGFALSLRPTQPPLPNGDGGYSAKSSAAGSASYYYSVPQLQVSGTVWRGARGDKVSGTAWLDHEWSSAYLDPHAVGWDWIGINFDDGGALMAFRIRGSHAENRWAGGTYRGPGGAMRIFGPQDVDFGALGSWRSARTAIVYPVRWRIRAGDLRLELSPLMDDQENDARATSGAIYWEGAVTASVAGRRAGRGYLELTGYGRPLQLR